MSANGNVIITAEDRTQAAFASLRNNINGVSSFLNGLKGQLLAIAGAAGFGALIMGAINAGDQIEKLSQRLGASTEALSQYRHVAELSNVSFESLTKGWQLMEKNISLAVQKIGPAKDAFQELGLSVDDLKKLNPENQFEVLADAINQVKDPADKVRLAMQVFGKSGAELIPIMEGGSTAIRAAREEADRLGLTLDETAAHQMAEAQDAMTRLKSALQGVANTLAVQFAPALAEAATWLNEHLPSAVDAAVRAFIRFKETIALALSTVLSALSELYSLFGKLPGALGQPFREGAEAADHFKNKMFEAVSGYEKQMGEMNATEKEHHSAIQQTGKTFNELYNPALQAAIEQKIKSRGHTNKLTEAEKEYKKALEESKRLTEEVRTPQEVYADHLKDINRLLNEGFISHETYSRAVKKYQKELDDASGVTKTLEDQKKLTEDHVKKITDIFRNGFFAFLDEGFDGMVKSFQNALAAMAADAAANELSRLLFGNVADSALKGDSGILGQFLGDGFGKLFGFSSFGGFKASGGSVLAGKGYIVGEQGPEFFMPKQNGSILPNDKLTQKTEGGTSIVMHIHTPDANSFRRSSGQITAELGLAIQRAIRRNT